MKLIFILFITAFVFSCVDSREPADTTQSTGTTEPGETAETTETTDNSNTNKTVIYENDFSANSLDDFIVVEIGVATVSISQGRLQITPGESYLNRGFVAIDLAAISSEYNPVLDANITKITWAFNASNMDGSTCGACNNTFGFKLFSHSDPSNASAYGYSFSGGGYVGNRMILSQSALAGSPHGPVNNIMIDITDGLGPLPSIGAFKITYDPNTSVWELYYEESTTTLDPMSITNMIGSSINNNFANQPLQYLILYGMNTQLTLFDNLTIAIDN